MHGEVSKDAPTEYSHHMNSYWNGNRNATLNAVALSNKPDLVYLNNDFLFPINIIHYRQVFHVKIYLLKQKTNQPKKI